MGTVAAQAACSAAQVPTAAALIDILERAIHSSQLEWLSFANCGWWEPGAQQVDAFAINTLPHTGIKRVSYEVKSPEPTFCPS